MKKSKDPSGVSLLYQKLADSLTATKFGIRFAASFFRPRQTNNYFSCACHNGYLRTQNNPQKTLY